MQKQSPISKFIQRAKNMLFFPGIGSAGIPSPKNTNYYPVIEKDAKELNRYRGPVQLMRIKIDTSIWRQAIIEAERPLSSLPYRVIMQQMFIDTVLNGHVFACMQKRKDLVLCKQFVMKDEAGNEDEEGTEIVNSYWFRQIVNYILDAEAYGYSLITFGDIINDELPNIQITRRADVSPDREVLSSFQYIPTGIRFNDPTDKDPSGLSYYDWSLYVPTPSENGVSKCGYGYLYKVALYEIILRSIIGWNTDYVEMYGQPTRVFSTVKDSEEERAKVSEMLQNLASAGWIIKDPNDMLELSEPNGGSGTGWQSYDNLEARCKKIISSIILGHEDAISSTPGKLGASQGEESSPQAQALAEKESYDSRFVEYIVNGILIPKLIKLGIKLPIGKKFTFKNDTEDNEIKKREGENAKLWSEVAFTMHNAGLQIDSAMFEEKTGIKAQPVAVQVERPQFPKGFQNKLKKTYAPYTRASKKK